MKKLAIIGYPVSHSFSPAMHNFISEKVNADYRYEAIEIPPERLGEGVLKLREDNICGFNVTAPHKFEILKYLDEVSEQAKRYGAVNTVVNKDGRLIGFNTDADGFYMSLLNCGITPEGANILMLGAGGAAQPVAIKLAEIGAASITVINRTAEKAERLREYVKACTGYEISTEKTRGHYDIVINCTTLGMGKNKDMSPLSDLSVIDENTAVVDMIYNPSETVLLKSAKGLGAKTVNGLGMLIFQGILAYRLFTGIDIPDSISKDIQKEVFKV
ncbi:MAG: shikimate dehydrogenase [Clostridia bacterium]|nr:shikimate dehydrogenase [Clostridia bacterium]MBP3360235.1 shikimate dehydrogenase [Clostridia bacterium]